MEKKRIYAWVSQNVKKKIRTDSFQTNNELVRTFDVATHSPMIVGIEMVFDFVMDALKFCKYEWHGFAHDVGKYVESTSMGHSQNEAMGTQFGCQINGIFQSGHDGLSSIQTESFGGIEFKIEKIFKRIGKTQSFEYVLFLFFIVF
jgi:hypothetical protein